MGGTKFGGSPGRCPVFPSPTFYLALVKRTEEQMRGGGQGMLPLLLGGLLDLRRLVRSRGHWGKKV